MIDSASIRVEAVSHPQHAAVEGREQPLVRVRDDRVGEVHTAEQPVAELGAHRGHAGPGGVDVQPRSDAVECLRNGLDVVDRAGRGGADGRLHEQGRPAVVDVVGEQQLQGPDVHGLGGRIDLDGAHALGTQAGHHGGLQERGVCLRRAVDGPLRRPDADLAGVPVAGGVQGGQERGEGRGGRGVLDDTTTAAVVGEPELVGQAERLGQPVDDHLLDLGDRRAGRPDHPLRADATRDEVAEDRRRGRVRREVGEEAGVLPVGQARHDELIEVGEQRVERLARLRGLGRQGAAYVAGRHPGEDRQVVQAGPVVGDPVDGCMALAAELLGTHVRLLDRPVLVHGPNVLPGVEQVYSGRNG